MLQNDNDYETREAVEAALRWTPQLIDAAQIGVAVHHGVVTLSGEVSSYSEKVAAGKAALRTSGVTAIANEVTVRYRDEMCAVANLADDAGATLAVRIRDALRSAPYVPDDSVDVEVRDHAVYLSGTVSWAHERLAAERAVEGVCGVRVLNNHIRVRPRVSVAETEAAILAALAEHGSRVIEDVTVDVDGDCVTLSGEVSSYSARMLAERAVAAMPRVRSVHNKLRIVRP